MILERRVKDCGSSDRPIFYFLLMRNWFVLRDEPDYSTFQRVDVFVSCRERWTISMRGNAHLEFFAWGSVTM
jgi:hypothetical protein